MTQHCCVTSCKHSRKNSVCMFKRFPSDPHKAKVWENAANSGPWKRQQWDRICECHFDDEQFEKYRQDGLRKLRWDAVPTLFGNNARLPTHRQNNKTGSALYSSPKEQEDGTESAELEVGVTSGDSIDADLPEKSVENSYEGGVLEVEIEDCTDDINPDSQVTTYIISENLIMVEDGVGSTKTAQLQVYDSSINDGFPEGAPDPSTSGEQTENPSDENQYDMEEVPTGEEVLEEETYEDAQTSVEDDTTEEQNLTVSSEDVGERNITEQQPSSELDNLVYCIEQEPESNSGLQQVQLNNSNEKYCEENENLEQSQNEEIDQELEDSNQEQNVDNVEQELSALVGQQSFVSVEERLSEIVGQDIEDTVHQQPTNPTELQQPADILEQLSEPMEENLNEELPEGEETTDESCIEPNQSVEMTEENDPEPFTEGEEKSTEVLKSSKKPIETKRASLKALPELVRVRGPREEQNATKLKETTSSKQSKNSHNPKLDNKSGDLTESVHSQGKFSKIRRIDPKFSRSSQQSTTRSADLEGKHSHTRKSHLEGSAEDAKVGADKKIDAINKKDNIPVRVHRTMSTSIAKSSDPKKREKQKSPARDVQEPAKRDHHSEMKHSSSSSLSKRRDHSDRHSDNVSSKKEVGKSPDLSGTKSANSKSQPGPSRHSVRVSKATEKGLELRKRSVRHSTSKRGEEEKHTKPSRVEKHTKTETPVKTERVKTDKIASDSEDVLTVDQPVNQPTSSRSSKRKLEVNKGNNESEDEKKKRKPETVKPSDSEESTSRRRKVGKSAENVIETTPVPKDDSPVVAQNENAEKNNDTVVIIIDEPASVPETPKSVPAKRGRKPKRKLVSKLSAAKKTGQTESGSKSDELTEELALKLCRLCGSEQTGLINVFGVEGKTLRLAEKIHNLLPVKFVEEEPIPAGVCHPCIVTLIACQSLFEKSKNMDERLRIFYKCPAKEEGDVRKEEVSGPATSVSRPTRSPTKLPETATSGESVPEEPAKEVQNIEVDQPLGEVQQNAADASEGPPTLEAELPQSQSMESGQPVSIQPPVLQPQPSDEQVLQESPNDAHEMMQVDQINEDDLSSSPAKRFGNTYRPRSKLVASEKLEMGLEPSISETQQFHIVELELADPQEGPSFDDTSNTNRISVVDSILVDWSGDEEDDSVAEQMEVPKTSIVPVSTVVSSTPPDISFNGSDANAGPCLFGEEDEVFITVEQKRFPPEKQKVKVEIAKKDSFWPEPAADEATNAVKEKEEDVPWKCTACGARGKSISKFREHKESHKNDTKKLVSCSMCSESFSTKRLLTMHMKSHNVDDDEEDEKEEKPIRQTRQTRQTRQRAKAPVDEGVTVFQEELSLVEEMECIPDKDGLYRCKKCENTFANIESLREHNVIHTKDDPLIYRCTECKRTFFDRKEYQEHVLTHQPGADPVGVFHCAECDLKFATQKQFLRHANTHSSSDSKFHCDLCNKDFDTAAKLRSHKNGSHKGMTYACHLCEKICYKRITLVEHIRKHTGENPFACQVCDKRFNRLANYRAHMMIHENARRYACPYCGKRFNRQSIQQRHMKTHTDEPPRKHRCRVCDLAFFTLSETLVHRKLHSREELEYANWHDEKQRLALTSYPCKVCGTKFTSVDLVLNHMPSHTDDERDIAVKLKNPTFQCDICQKVLFNKRKFNMHRTSHIDGKPFVCKICQKGYSTSAGLKYHYLSHTGERPYQCTYCSKGHKNKTDLKVHMRQHTGEFPFKCTLCNKAFRSSSSLQKHGDVHSSERPFKCQYCDMGFKRESTKANHERIHTNDRRFKCKVCSRSFIQKGACDAHEKLHFRGQSRADGILRDISRDIGKRVKSGDSELLESNILEEEEIIEDPDEEEDEYILYDDEDDEDDEEEEDDITFESESVKIEPCETSNSCFTEATINADDESLQGITLMPVSISTESAPSADDSSVHITILP